MLALLARRRVAGMILMLAAAASRADGPDGYANTIPVSVSGRQAVVQLQVPRAVYLEARSKDLRDLRLFDAAGTPMPFALVGRMRQDQVSRSTAPVAIFPVRGPGGAGRLPDGLQIRTRDDGTVISVTAPAARSAGDEMTSLVLDMRPHGDAAVTALALTLPPGTGNYSARVVLETSDDLQRWAPLTEASVSWLVNSQGASVDQHRIEFAPRPFRYARIAWLEGKPVEFAAITADYVTETRAPEQWDSVVLRAADGRSGDDLVYAAPLAIPVEAVGLVFHGENVVLPAVLGQYREAPGGAGLREVVRATFYQLTQNGQRRVSDDVEVPLTHADQWVLRPRAKVSDRPELRLRWKPATIVFVAGGKGPYTLAFGRDGAQAGDLPLDQVAPGFSAGEVAALEQAKAGAPVRQAGRAGGMGAASAGILRSSAFWLWALLLCGVAALAAMAWRLARQLKDGSSGQPPA
jgi:hypothetical protein